MTKSASSTYPAEFYQTRETRGLVDLIEDRMTFLNRSDHSQKSGPFLIRFRLDSRLFDDLLLELSKMGVSGNVLFPTYSGVVESLTEELYFPER